ncbi:PhnD/SsuA/transferrin family substrate-binding protein [Microvirga sp. VF16]|uniref:substrate-binding domain-containing protein n=1 Tax=Microvirga sp. VF16 TaxID=2807101 RepID=UPI00193E7B76|nr:PhnD/SsuA/transferrin family substrate-binding protein [Microvirga sp. VF16]QRM34348.1 PhnD/SsuA/transferrin family substrate-binding protein [Microvirga sp. VF16]
MDRPGLSRREVVSGILALATVTGVPPAVAAPEELRFGLTPVFLTSDLELLDRLRSYLEHATGFPVRLVTRRTYQEITSLLLSGQLDAAWICGYPFVANQPRLALVAVPVWRGRPLYRSYLITGRDRQADGLKALKGDVHAFSDPDSNSGWLVTAAALARDNRTPERFFGRTIFTYGHRNVIRAVASGLAMSGSVDGYVYEVMRETEPDLIAPTKVIRQSEPMGFPPIACAASIMDASRTEALRTALVRMADHPDGQAVLRLLRLDGFSIEAPGLYDMIAAEMAVVRGGAG